jgi:acetolactate synthase-1/2/3 large subunit
MSIKASDAIVSFLIKNNITDVFGYPGGMIAYILDSFKKFENLIKFHLSYHEQGAAFEACSYAIVSGKTGVVFSSSGPGATNLITGIAQAYFDSIPVVFITGQVNTSESSIGMPIKQRGFQEINIVDIVKPITKGSFYIKEKEEINNIFLNAFQLANSGRKGPVLIDFPMNLQRCQLPSFDYSFLEKNNFNVDFLSQCIRDIKNALSSSKRPVIILGNGIKNSPLFSKKRIKELTSWNTPVVCSLPAIDLLPSNQPKNLGMFGTYGKRIANIVLDKADLIISLGARLDIRQVGSNRSDFAPNAKLIRIDIDDTELTYKLHNNDKSYCLDAFSVLSNLDPSWLDKPDWCKIISKIKRMLKEANAEPLEINDVVSKISKHVKKDSILTTDVGQNQIWVAQSFYFQNQTLITSSGLGSMGYSLPAAIGACFACHGSKNIISFNGDGGIQMNIQELGVIARDKLPIKVVIFNNEALGMIRAFQENVFNEYYLTTKESGYSNPDFSFIAKAYNMEYSLFTDLIDYSIFTDKKSRIIEIPMNYPTYAYPKLSFGERNDNQEPYLNKDILSKIRSL